MSGRFQKMIASLRQMKQKPVKTTIKKILKKYTKTFQKKTAKNPYTSIKNTK
jgi:hypothetical protein